jgi:hypothetical protein
MIMAIDGDKTTEDMLLDDIMAADDSHLNDDMDDFEDEQEQPAPQQAATEPEDSEEQPADGEPAEPEVEAAKGDAAKRPDKQDETKKAVRANKDGDLVDAEGNVIARRGKERRLYHTVERQDKVIQDLRSQMEQMADYAARMEHLHEMPKRMGLTPQDLENTYRYAQLVKSNPVAGAKSVLAMVLSQGYTLDQIIGADNGVALNTSAIQQMIDTRLGPIAQERQQRIIEQQVETQAQQSVNTFYVEHPDAEVHENDIVGLMREMAQPGEDPLDTARRAWSRLRNFIQERGLDPELPVKPQLIARAQQQKRSQQAPVQQPRQMAPMPSGRGAQSVQQQSVPMAKANESWDDIIRRNLT